MTLVGVSSHNFSVSASNMVSSKTDNNTRLDWFYIASAENFTVQYLKQMDDSERSELKKRILSGASKGLVVQDINANRVFASRNNYQGMTTEPEAYSKLYLSQFESLSKNDYTDETQFVVPWIRPFLREYLGQPPLSKVPLIKLITQRSRSNAASHSLNSIRYHSKWTHLTCDQDDSSEFFPHELGGWTRSKEGPFQEERSVAPPP